MPTCMFSVCMRDSAAPSGWVWTGETEHNVHSYVSQCLHVCFQYVCVTVLLLVAGYAEAGQNFPPEAQYLTMQTFRTINPDIVSMI